MVPVGLAQASSIFVGNMIGQKKMRDAQVYAKMGALCALMWGCFFVFIMSVFQKHIIELFSSSPEINQLVERVFFILEVYVLFDAMNGMGIGLIMGIGAQAKASIYTICGFWLLGVPTSTILSFVFDLDLIGLWSGSLVAVTFCMISYYTLLIRTDWS